MNTDPAHPARTAIHVWLLPLTEPSPARWWTCLDAHERARAERFRHAVERDRFVAAHALLRALLSASGDRGPGDWVFTGDANGKPCLREQAGMPAASFSLSHTRGLVAAAVDPAGRALGLDVEAEHRTLAPGLARRLLSADERARLAGLDAASFRRAVLRRWVLKEAVAKATGKGVALGLRRVGFASTARPVPEFEPDPLLGDPRDWDVTNWSAAGTHRVALAVHSRDLPVGQRRIRELRPTDLDCLVAS